MTDSLLVPDVDAMPWNSCAECAAASSTSPAGQPSGLHAAAKATTSELRIADEVLIPALYAAINPVVMEARRQTGGRLPHLRSTEFVEASVVVQRAVLLVLGSSYTFGDPGLRLLREVSRDVHGGDHRTWRALAANHIPYDELQRRRAVPGPLSAPAGASGEPG